MKKSLLLALVLCILIFQGCELFLGEEPLGSIHAIYVGLNYHGTGVRHLKGTLNDAQELQECLAGLSTRHHRGYESYSLLQRGGVLSSDYDDPKTASSLPTKSNVLQHIRALDQILTENDLTIFSYSGHGYDDGSLVLASPNLDGKILFDENYKPQDEEVLLSVTELLTALSELPGKQLLILDSCYCGSFVEESGSSVNLIEKSRFLDEAFTLYFSSAEYKPSLFVLAATTSDNTSKEPANTAHSHGFFTSALLEGLGWDNENKSLFSRAPAMKKGVLTIDSLYAYVLENQDFPTKGIYPSQYQHPTISGGAYTLRLF
ncbi:MAG TPA: caspase family protein [Sphaerochaeta sp.]|nr:caspase family protein [Sphaerochaeta sp.]